MSDGGESGDTGGRGAVGRSRRAGLVYRLRAAGRALVLLAACAVSTSVISTATGMYHHMDTTTHDGDEVAATADVGACWRTGPIAWNALGYWWECQVLVRTVEGRVVLVSVDRSMVTPADVGRPVKFLEICNERSGQCRYGVPEWPGHWLGYSVLTVVHVLVAGLLIILALAFLKTPRSGRGGSSTVPPGPGLVNAPSGGRHPRRTARSTSPACWRSTPHPGLPVRRGPATSPTGEMIIVVNRCSGRAVLLVVGALLTGCGAGCDAATPPQSIGSRAASPPVGPDATTTLDGVLQGMVPMSRGSGGLEKVFGNSLPAVDPGAVSLAFMLVCTGPGAVSVELSDDGRRRPSAAEHRCGDGVFTRSMEVTPTSRPSFTATATRPGATDSFAYAWSVEKRTVG